MILCLSPSPTYSCGYSSYAYFSSCTRTDFHSDNPCHYTMYFLILCRSHQMYRAFAIPWLSQKYTSYANYVLLKNRQLFSNLKLNPLYTQSEPSIYTISSIALLPCLLYFNDCVMPHKNTLKLLVGIYICNIDSPTPLSFVF